MKCYYHENKDAVGTCKECGKSLCKTCVDKYKSGLCESCEQKRKEKAQKVLDDKKAKLKMDAKSVRNDTIKDLVVAGVLSVVCAIIGYSIEGFQGLLMFIGFPWGWKLINQLMTGNFMGWLMVLTDKFWIVAYILKFGLALFIGAFTWPFFIGYKIYIFIKANNFEKETRNM